MLKSFFISIAPMLYTAALGKCVYIGGEQPDENGNCPGSIATSDGRCVPRPVNVSAGEDLPHVYTGVIPTVCPMYDEVCCSDGQMISLDASLSGVWGSFGDIGAGGCPACYQNMVEFWCGFACSPNQSDFVTLGSPPFENKTDPNSGQVFPVLSVELRLDATYGCTTFGSCQGTGRVKEFSPLQTCEGFFRYQGSDQAIGSGLVYIDFLFSQLGASLQPSFYSRPTYSCCNFPADIGPNYPGMSLNVSNTSCPCASCPGMCPGGKCSSTGAKSLTTSTSTDALKGFSSLYLGLWMGGLLGIPTIISLISSYTRSHGWGEEKAGRVLEKVILGSIQEFQAS